MLIDKLKKALIKDFEELHVKEFSTTWKLERMVRNVEINMMSFDNLRRLISAEIDKTADERTKTRWNGGDK